LKDKAKSDIPFFATFMFTLFLFVLLIFGIESIVHFLLKTTFILSRYLVYLLVVVFAIPNYFYVFKDNKVLEYFDHKLSAFKTTAIILLIFVGSLVSILLGGVRK
jgi:hypothetical protein